MLPKRLDRFWFSLVLLWRYSVKPAGEETAHSLRRSGLIGGLFLAGLVPLVLVLLDREAGNETVGFVTLGVVLIAFSLVVFFWTAAMQPIRRVRELESQLTDRDRAETWQRGQARSRLNTLIVRAGVIRKQPFGRADLGARATEIDAWVRSATEAVEAVAPDRTGWFTYDADQGSGSWAPDQTPALIAAMQARQRDRLDRYVERLTQLMDEL